MALQLSRLVLSKSHPTVLSSSSSSTSCSCLLTRATTSAVTTSKSLSAVQSTYHHPSHSTPLGLRYASSKGKAAAPAKKKSGAFSASSQKRGGGMDVGGSDSKNEALRKYLYGDDASARKARDLERKQALEKAIPDLEVHETIVRAWQLHKRKTREEQEAGMARRYESMRAAIEELERTSKRLFDAAVHGPKFSTVRGTKGEQGKKASAEGRIEGLFPRQLPVLR